MPSKRSFLIVSVIFLILALCVLIGGCSTKQSPKQVAAENTVVASPEKGPAEQIIFQFNWLPTEYPVKFVALEKGFWAEQNLDVKIIRGYGSADTLTKLSAKKADFAIVDFGALILARANEDIPVKAIANYHTYHPAGVIYRADSDIKYPKDLEGKTIVTTATSAFRFFWPAFAQAAGVDESKVQLKLVDPSLQQPTFVKGQVDGWLSDNQSIYVLDKLGINAGFFSFKNDGNIDRYGDSIVVHEDTIAENPDLVKRFIVGFLKGVEYSIAHPEEAAKIWKKHVAEIDAEMAAKIWQGDIEMEVMLSDENRENGLGWMSREKVIRSIESVIIAYNLQSEIKPELVYTTDFLPKEPIFPPKK